MSNIKQCFAAITQSRTNNLSGLLDIKGFVLHNKYLY